MTRRGFVGGALGVLAALVLPWWPQRDKFAGKADFVCEVYREGDLVIPLGKARMTFPDGSYHLVPIQPDGSIALHGINLKAFANGGEMTFDYEVGPA